MFNLFAKASHNGEKQSNSVIKELNQRENADLPIENEKSTLSHFQPQIYKTKYFPIFYATNPGVKSEHKANHSSSHHSYHHQHPPRGGLRPKKQCANSSQKLKTKPISEYFKSQNYTTSSNTESAHQNQPNLKDPK